MRFLGIDYGGKRIGLAVSDGNLVLVRPLPVVVRKGKELEIISRIAEENNIGRIIFGLPVNMDGTHGFSADAVKKFADCLKDKTGIPIEYQDERLTTVEADSMMANRGVSRRKRKEKRDSICACIILKSYLDAHSSRT